jgi:carboxylate-amine ligase
VIRDRYNLYWSMRPHPEYPTIEFRVMDACPSLRDAGAIGAFARAIVHAAVTGVIGDDAPSHFGVTTEQELVRINEWCAARDGLGARWIDSRTATGDMPMTDAIARLLESIAPSFEELGDSAALAHIEKLLDRGNAADHMRRVHSDGNMKELMAWLIEETLTGTGLDRRGAARSDS